MSTSPRFFSFDPRPTRAALFLGACVLAVLSAWALADARAGGGLQSVARAGVSAGLMLAFLFALHRLRPRTDWGVTLDASGVRVARPFSGSPLELSWSQIESVRRLGRRGGVLGLFLKEEGRVLVTRHLFARKAVYEELIAALEDRLPPSRFDA
ncbi:hypothetical protein DRW03_20035 [Corallococcus sp. H22C18031201]|uniref:hypothetical protein n=1 Tax=Citreicoccus inhibens TaxID=2849499 RepID=UPI000E70BB16|nr:hypothetical protein [Citreicoccus inhibens]MBJ6760521.1 hypothetical protein [Myxococcaceae bacterium JPH2]MBU8895625.1 hypothetical protein [Citreicoccus inhibens]RJS20061.1 hypothetical protein DRW03_20035 [Corallococcus sp. H22C18031201]